MYQPRLYFRYGYTGHTVPSGWVCWFCLLAHMDWMSVSRIFSVNACCMLQGKRKTVLQLGDENHLSDGLCKKLTHFAMKAL